MKNFHVAFTAFGKPRNCPATTVAAPGCDEAAQIVAKQICRTVTGYVRTDGGRFTPTGVDGPLSTHEFTLTEVCPEPCATRP